MAETLAIPRVRTRSRKSSNLDLGAGIGLGLTVVWFSLLVLIPLSLIVITSVTGGWATFAQTLSNPQTAAAIGLTVRQAFLVTVVNSVLGTLIAWVLVRDDFWGKRAFEVIIDIPFALPTLVAGLVLLSTYGPRSPIGLDVTLRESSVAFVLLLVSVFAIFVLDQIARRVARHG